MSARKFSCISVDLGDKEDVQRVANYLNSSFNEEKYTRPRIDVAVGAGNRVLLVLSVSVMGEEDLKIQKAIMKKQNEMAKKALKEMGAFEVEPSPPPKFEEDDDEEAQF